MILALMTRMALGQSCVVIEHGKAHLPDGVEAVTVTLFDGKIAAIGAVPASLRDCERVDATGRQLTAGFIAVPTELGLHEVSLEGSTVDSDAGGDPVRAAVRIVESYNPRSSLIPVARLGGVTSAVVVPWGGLISGQCGWVDLAGATQAQTVIDDSIAMGAGLRWGGSPARGLESLRELFYDVREFRERREDWAENRSRAFSASWRDMEALQPVVDGELPLLFAVDRAADIEALLGFVEQEEVKVVILGGAEAWLLADSLAAAGVSVVVDPLVYGPGSFSQIHARKDNARLLAEAGVNVVLSSFSTHGARTLRQIAGNAVRSGLDHETALAGITRNAADAFGMAERGRLEVGAAADVVVWSGDPLELSSSAVAMYIGGAPVSLQSRQTALRERYRDLPGSPLQPLDAPAPKLNIPE